MSIAALLTVLVLLAALAVQAWTSRTVDSSQRKMVGAGSTQLAWERVHELVKSSRCVRVPDTASPVVQEELRRAGLEGASVLYADGTEILVDPRSGGLYVDGSRETGVHLSAAHFEILQGEELLVFLAADESAPSSAGGARAVREQSAISGRVFLHAQADAARWGSFPVEPHDWCLGGEPLTYGLARAGP